MKREEGNSLQTCSLEMIKIQHSGGGAGWRIELQTNLCKDLIFTMEKAPTTICRHDSDTKVGQSSVKVLVKLQSSRRFVCSSVAVAVAVRCDEARSVLCWPDLALRYLVGNQLQSISFWFGSDIKYIIRSRNVCFRFISMFLLTD